SQDRTALDDLRGFESAVRTLAKIDRLELVGDGERPSGSAVAVAGGLELYVPLAGLIDVGAERQRLEREIERVAKELAPVTRKLENQDFLARAPEEIVEKERAKASELTAKQELLQRGLERLREVQA